MGLVIFPLYQCYLLKFSWAYVQQMKQTEQPPTSTTTMNSTKVETLTTFTEKPMETTLEIFEHLGDSGDTGKELQEARQIIKKIQFWIEYLENKIK